MTVEERVAELVAELPPLTDEAIAVIGRLTARIDARLAGRGT